MNKIIFFISISNFFVSNLPQVSSNYNKKTYKPSISFVLLQKNTICKESSSVSFYSSKIFTDFSPGNSRKNMGQNNVTEQNTKANLRLEHIFIKVICHYGRFVQCFFFFFLNNIYLVTTLLMTILTFTWRKNKNNVQEIKEKYL